MTTAPKPRPHLVERAVEAFGGSLALERLAQSTPTSRPESLPLVAAVAETPPPALAVANAPDLSPPAAASPPQPIDIEVMKRAGLVVAVAGIVRSRLSEEVSLVQHHLLRTLRATPSVEGRSNRLILVTSARPGEGKTFNSLNIAASIAGGGAYPVLLVDADGKRGSLSELLGVADRHGLRLLATDPSIRPTALCLETAQPRLSFLPYGAPIPGQAEVPPGAMVAAAIQRIAAALPNHVIILDSPPCLATSDPSSLAAVVGQVLMVVEAERTQRNEVEAALDMVDACPTLQLMLNRIRLTANDTFGAYGGYDVYGAYGAQPSS